MHQGHKSRYRTADDIEKILRDNNALGIKKFFITDDNFARNKNWEAIFDRIIKLRQEEGMMFSFIIQVDTMCHKIENFVTKAGIAGCQPDLHWARKHQSGQSQSGKKRA